jgi:dephospho-CoA kinase
MIRIAVVGDIGSGKSHISKLFGLPVFNADSEVSKLYKKSRRCYFKLKKALPNHEISFPVNKNTLTEAILKNNYNIKKIVEIVHPEIRVKMNEFIKKNKSKKAIVLDIPLLMENKINKKSDILVFVEANKTEILKRLKRRANFNKKVYKRFKKLQLSLEMKKKKSNFLIKNNFNNQLAKKNVKIILDKILYD